MGNYRFRLSDMMPNAWFYKLREIGSRNHPNSNHKTKQQQLTGTAATSANTNQPHHSYPRKSYHFTRDLTPIPPETLYKFPDPPRKSSKQRTRQRKSSSQKTVMSSSVSSGCGCRAKPDSPAEYYASSSSFSSSDCSPDKEFRSDSVLATAQSCNKVDSLAHGVIENKSSSKQSDTEFDDLGKFLQLELPPIITKPNKLSETDEEATKTEHVKKATGLMTNSEAGVAMKERKPGSSTIPVPVRQSNVNGSSGVRLRVNSPRLAASRKVQGPARRSSQSRRRSLSDSLAVVKSSADPQRDFRESMVEMIVENNIRGSKELEDLLACYLSLNSDQYHDLIIKVFKQIWFDLSHVR